MENRLITCQKLLTKHFFKKEPVNQATGKVIFKLSIYLLLTMFQLFFHNQLTLSPLRKRVNSLLINATVGSLVRMLNK